MLRCEHVVAPGPVLRISASRATIAETPLFEVCSAKVGPCHFVLHQHLSWVSGHHLRGSLHSEPECHMHCHCHPETMKRLAFRVLCPRPISPILLMFAERVLIAVPCSVTTTASDDEFSIPTNTPGWNRGFPFSPSRWLARHVQDLLSEFQNRCVVPSTMQPLQWRLFRRCRCHTCSSGTQQNSARQHRILASGGILVSMRCSNTAFQCSGVTGNESHRAFADSIGLAFSHLRSLRNNLAGFPFLACLAQFPLPALQSLARCHI